MESEGIGYIDNKYFRYCKNEYENLVEKLNQFVCISCKKINHNRNFVIHLIDECRKPICTTCFKNAMKNAKINIQVNCA